MSKPRPYNQLLAERIRTLRTQSEMTQPPLWVIMNTQRWTPTAVLRHFGIGKPAVDIRNLAQNIGAEVHFVREVTWDGALESTPSGAARIFVNATQHPTRQRFAIAHELGHLLQHRPGVVFRDDFSSTGTNQAEIQANRFGAELLMPRSMVEPLVSSGRTRIEGLADIFQVSSRAMEVRLKKLGYRVG